MAQPADEGGQEMTNMFASVWVKVEVQECEEEGNRTLSPEPEPEPPHVTPTPANPPTARKKRNPPTKLMYCDVCGYSTPYKSCLIVHVTGHTDAKPYDCKFCSYRTKFYSSLRRHTATRHGKHETGQQATSFPCNMCDYVSYCKWNLQAHKRKHKTEKKYKCDYEGCTYESAYRNVYTKHLKRHYNNSTVYRCDKCSFETKYPGHIQRHLARIHDELFPDANVCDLCGFSYDQQWKLKMHLLRSKRRVELTCECCGWKTVYRCAFRKHKFAHIKKVDEKDVKVENEEMSDQLPVENTTGRVPIETFTCEQCPEFVATSKGHLQRHSLENHYEMDSMVYKCETCPYTTPDRWKSNMHRQVNTMETVMLCPWCDFSTTQRCGMKYHKRTVHFNEINAKPPRKVRTSSNASSSAIKNPPGEINELPVKKQRSYLAPNYTQEELSQINQSDHEKSNNYVFEQHAITVDFHAIPVLETQDEDKSFQCGLCKYTSKFKATVQRHYQRHHTGDNIKPYKCINCDFSTKTKDQITLHNKRSQSKVTVHCETCSYSSLFKCSLNLHQKIHYPYRCYKCEYVCRHKYELVKHTAAYHLGNCLSCSYCDFTAARKDTIANHETIHTGNKPFKCRYCEYSTIRKAALEKHLNKHHKMKRKSKSKVKDLKSEPFVPSDVVEANLKEES